MENYAKLMKLKKNPGNFNLTRKIEIISLVEKVVKIHIEKNL